MKASLTLRRSAIILALLVSSMAAARPAAGPSGTWIGQDGHDLVGHNAALAGNDCQDVHIALSGLPPRREIAYGSLKGLGGGEWQYKGGPGSWLAQIERKPGSGKADLYFDPRQGRGRPGLRAAPAIRRRLDGQLLDQGRQGRPRPPHAGRRAQGEVDGPGRARSRGAGAFRRAGRAPGRPPRRREPLAKGRDQDPPRGGARGAPAGNSARTPRGSKTSS